MIKTILRKTLTCAVRNDFVWAAIKKLPLSVARFAIWRRIKYEEEQLKKTDRDVVSPLIEDLCPNLTVLNGIFKGMKYPQTRSVGSVLFPKLLGSYERELYPYISDLSHHTYTEIVDIGCAEGYYAVGMALLFPNVTVYAYDTNREAIELCKEMARLNGVEGRMVFGSFCDLDELRRIRFRGRALVFSDCEGYEKHLFNQNSVELLSPHDLIIEAHDGIDGTISQGICSAFENSHQICRVEVPDDSHRLRTYRYKELAQYDIGTVFRLIRECRWICSQWLILKSKTESFSANNALEGTR